MRILVVGDPRSVHCARFVQLLQEIGHEVHLFAVELQYEQDEHLRGVTLHVPMAYASGERGNLVRGRAPWLAVLCRSRLLRRFVTRFLYADAKPGKVRGAARLARVLERCAPALVISLKMQNEGYAVAAAHALMGSRLPVPWVHFSWGTDMEFFGRHPDHRGRHLPLIRNLLSRCDFHIADTQRDLDQAIAFGFRGHTLGAIPATGGFDMGWLERLRGGMSEARDTILVKGRQGGYVGKALHVVEAIRRRPEDYRGWRVRFFMASASVVLAAEALRREHGIDSEALPRLGFRELLGWYARSAIAVSASEVDGTPGFLLEAMAMGAFPVHSDMASLREWIDNGRNGLLFPVNDVERLGDCLRSALSNEALRARAAVANYALMASRANRDKIREQVAGWLRVATGISP